MESAESSSDKGLLRTRRTKWFFPVLAFCLATAFTSWLRGQSPGTITLSQTNLGNIFLTTERVEIPVVSRGDTVAWTVTDFNGVVTNGTTAVGAANQRALVHPGTGKTGYFELHLDARLNGSTVASADTTFAVVPPVDVSSMADSPFGVMTHFAQGWNTDLLPLVARAGLHHVRDEQYWETVETTRGKYFYNDGYVAYLAAVAANHLEPLMELTFGNALYDHDPGSPGTAWAPVTDDGRTGYANYGQSMLSQYGSQIRTVEVWNEYNGGFCVGPAANDRISAYSQMLKAAYQAIKNQRPDVRVLGGAAVLAPQPWFDDLFAAGALDYMDAAVIHPYYSLPEDVEKPILALQDSMSRNNHGRGPKPIWATETGLPDPSHPGRQDMARYLVRQLTLMRVLGVERVYWYLMRDYNDFTTGLLHSDRDPLGRYVPTSAYPAYANLIQQLYQAQSIRRENTDLRTRCYLFNKNGGELRVLWSTRPPSRLQINTTKPLTVVDIMGVSQTVQPQNGTIVLNVDDNPVYVLGHIDSLREIGRDVLLADSVDGFGGVQGTVPGSWSYGYFAATATPYRTNQFQPMSWTRTSFDYSWACPYPYAMISNTVAGPSASGNTPVWTIRRWQSNSKGTARITGTATHVSTGGDGTGVKILVDGNEVFSSLVGASGGPAAATFDVNAAIEIGSLVDFVVTPGPGADINFDAVDYRAQVTLPAAPPITTYHDWQQNFFDADQLADPTISGDAAEPLNDGLCNLLRYAFGLDRSVNAADQHPQLNVQLVDSVPYLTLRYRRRSNITDLNYVVEVAGDVVNHDWAPGGLPFNSPIDNGDATETVVYRDDFPFGFDHQRFMRLRVIRLPE